MCLAKGKWKPLEPQTRPQTNVYEREDVPTWLPNLYGPYLTITPTKPGNTMGQNGPLGFGRTWARPFFGHDCPLAKKRTLLETRRYICPDVFHAPRSRSSWPARGASSEIDSERCAARGASTPSRTACRAGKPKVRGVPG